ncbi:MAG TPA: hypothetical protein GX005_00375 [Bacteroidales bacterium]|nr:hypothetical protein [Bacteroidales bacterium]
MKNTTIKNLTKVETMKLVEGRRTHAFKKEAMNMQKFDVADPKGKDLKALVSTIPLYENKATRQGFIKEDDVISIEVGSYKEIPSYVYKVGNTLFEEIIKPDGVTKVMNYFAGDKTVDGPFNAIKYILTGGSASQLRQEVVLGFKADLDLRNIFDVCTNGWFKSIEGETMSEEKLCKVVARLFQFWSPNRSIAQVGPKEDFTLAIYMGIYSEDEEGNGLADGMAYMDNVFLAIKLSDLYGFEINPVHLLGLGLQTRPASSKCFTLSAHKDTIKELMKACGEVVRIASKDIRSAQPELVKAFDGEGLYAGKVVILGDGEISYFSDLNGYKHDWDFDRSVDFSVLALAVKSDTNISKQALEKFLVADPLKTGQWLRSKLEELSVVDFMKISEDDNKLLTVEDEKQGYVLNMLKKTNPAFINQVGFLKQTLLSLELGSIYKKTNISFKVKGSNHRVMSDFAHMFGFKIFKENEAYSPTLEGRGYAFKYPTLGANEAHMFNFLSIREIRRRVNELKCSYTIKAAILSMYESLWNAFIIVPASARLMNKLAGMDFDYDGLCIVQDEDLCKIHIKDRAIVIKEKLAANYEESVFGIDTIRVAMNKILGQDMVSVGSITNQSLSFTAAYVLGEFEAVKYQTFDELTEWASGEWILPEGDILVEDSKALYEQALTATKRGDCFLAINACYRTWQESIIDSTKTGATPEVHFDIPGIAKITRRAKTRNAWLSELRGNKEENLLA